MNTSDVLTIRDVSRRFGTRDNVVHALRGVSLACAPGTWTTVMGPSGSGKSTLLQCAAGLDRPTEGQVALAGHDLSALDDDELTQLRRTTIGFIFQGFNLIPALTAEQNVTLPMRLAGRRVDTAAVRRVLADLGLGERATHRPRELSGGQQQRVAIARAVITRPAVLFADEPTGALDTASAATVLDLVRALVDRHDQTVLMVTHDPTVAARSDRVVFMRDGLVVDQASGETSAQIAARLGGLEQVR
ncbi:ABC transporter ATP-binding protein [Nocardioides sp. zg-1228]|uniref:ABC transporter ATP-binding protein n=1 Tax=Nocardioides sp. zg-1228 TaxID=2763008 RepID=UPI0016425640|nr:ABC transporter ATP-binding protein [Nocardioides sp. zg-1228]MBC2933058.1 ABC transporter ATP-binding protein [Nocardioides sp. zg-1228]QSF56750.1 ABC transporter ATP-binding protein [Nocardioides sp. zg-1228]